MKQELPTDPQQVAARFNELVAKGNKVDLSLEETKELIELSRTLRRTNTGPAKTRKKRQPLSDDQLTDLLG